MKARICKTPDERFWPKVNKEAPNGCWTWTAATNGHYGSFWSGYPDDKKLLAHKFSWERFYGTVPYGLMVDHTCRNKLCVNPKHLQLVTPWGSQHFSTDETNAAKTHCKHGHSLMDARLVHCADGYIRRVCRVCDERRTDAYLLKKFGMVKGVHRAWKVTPASAEQMRAIYAQGQLSQTAIGKMFGVSNQTVSNVVLRRQAAFA